MRRALAIDESSYGAGHPKVAIAINNLAQLLKATNRLAEAEPLMRRSLEIIFHFCVNCGHLHPNLKMFVENYITILQQTGWTETEAGQHVIALAKTCGLEVG